MTEKMKTVCVGRYLVDVPAQATISTSRERIDGFAIETIEESEAAFRARIAAREAQIAAGNADGGAKAANEAKEAGGIIDVHDLRIAGMEGRTFVYGRTRSHGFEKGQRVNVEWVSVESHAHLGDLSFTLSAEYVQEGDAKAAEALLAQLRLRAEDDIPLMPGFCVSRAVFAEPLPPHETEHIAMHIGLPGHPDLALTFASIPGGGSEPNLIARSAEADASMGADVLSRMTTLREGKRIINGIDGEELLTRAREFNFTTTYGFNWETPGVDNDPLKPYLTLELQTGMSERSGGKPVDTSLHEDALLALWDSIASSIRLRKSEPPPPSGMPPAPSGPQLGALVTAGDACAQTGWWRCDAGGPGLDVHGGRIQFFHKGDRMPQALLLPQQTLWQKVRRVQPSMESRQPTTWTLVDRRQRARSTVTACLAQPGVAAHGFDAVADARTAVVIGTDVRTGEPCPASGWWRCGEHQALDGARWFARGVVMPVATFQVPNGLFARGGPQFIQRRSTWQLVRQADLPAVAGTTTPSVDVLLPAGPPERI